MTKKKSSGPDFQTVVDLYFWSYQAKYSALPTWSGACGVQLKRLIKAHSADEVIDRMNRMFEGQLKWADEPYTWSLLVSQFDRLVSVAPKSVEARFLASVADKLEQQGE